MGPPGKWPQSISEMKEYNQQFILLFTVWFIYDYCH